MIQFCARIILRHRYFNPAQIVCRLGIQAATAIWSIIVLVKTDALATTAMGPLLTHYVPENWIAAVLLGISGALHYRLLRESEPRIWGVFGYAAMLAYWLMLWSYVLLAQWLSRPAVFAALTVVVALGVGAFIANPRKPDDANPR